MSINIHYFIRKPEPHKKSLEGVFDSVIQHLSSDFQAKRISSKYVSRGLLNRIRIAVNAYQNQGKINHVTGDIHFIVPFLRKNSTILTIHDCGQYHKRNFISRLLFNLFWIIIPSKSARHITVISEQTKTELLALVKIPDSKISVIPNPVQPGYIYSPKKFNALKTRILQIGTKINKNLERVIKAVEGLDIVLVIIGRLNESQKQLLKILNIDYENKWDLTRKELYNEYMISDLLLFVSTYEGFGVPIIEANAVGRVVITSNIEPMKSIGKGSARLTNPYDISEIRTAILEIIDNGEERMKLIENGLNNAKNYHPGKIAREYEKIYMRINAG